MKIAIVEDAIQLAYQLRNVLTREKYIVRLFRDATSALQHIPVEEYDLCIVDVNLPDMTGYDLVRKIRANNPDVLILFLSVRDSVSDKIAGFEAGADDYMTKPFDISELLARIKANAKRLGPRSPEQVKLGDLIVDYDSQTIHFKDKSTELSVKEFHLLEQFIRNKGIIISKERLGDMLWDNSYELSENIVSVYIGKLRKKLIELTGEEFIKNVKNKGYIFNVVDQKPV